MENIRKVLKDFVIRVATGNATSDAEISILPEVTKILLKPSCHSSNQQSI
ncbi:hypothetical protein [Clostridium tyrobutyricum]|nr:hypothetical protein [Clostridium tyrobutyricum]MBV4417430.1 hypothetical protein [Clostridium tyrobutyricum]